MTQSKEAVFDPSVQGAASPAAWIWTAFYLLCLIAIAAALRRILVLAAPVSPGMSGPDMAFASRRLLTLSHIVPALLFVLLLPLWLSRGVRARPRLHRAVTYGLFLPGAIVGVTAAALSMHPIGGINEAAAALFYDALFLFSLARAWVFFRRRDGTLHRRWMLRAMAVLLGIATTRPVVGIFFATRSITHLSQQQFFGIAFWIGFTVTYLAGEAYLRARPDMSGNGISFSAEAPRRV
jgi:hypothetical protein